MSIVNEMSLNCNTNISINFDGGSLSSDSGMLLVKDFIHKIGLDHIVKKMFHTNDNATFRIHTDDENLLQSIYQIIAGYFEDDRFDDLKNELKLVAACTIRNSQRLLPFRVHMLILSLF